MHANRRSTVILCRHGESEGNREGRFGGHGSTPLTKLGRSQAIATGRALASAALDAIYTSDLPRAAETASLIGRAVGIAPAASAALRERSVGDMTGLTFEEARVRHPDAYAALLSGDPHACPPGGESYTQCRQRVSAFAEEALMRHEGARILLVSHQLTLLLLIQHLLGIPCEGPGLRPQFQIDQCALHRFERGRDGGWNVVALNERKHLCSV